MAMNRQTYLEMVISFISKLKNDTNFNLETPLDHNSRIKLAAIANSAKNMGEPSIGALIKKALESNDPKTQEIILYSGLESGPISDEEIKSVFQVASDKLQSMGGFPDEIAAQAVPPPPAPPADIAGDDLFGDALGEPEEELGAEELEEPPEEELPEEEPPIGDKTEEEPPEDEEGEAEEEPEEEMPEDEEGKGRIAKEGEPEEFEDDFMSPRPMNDWFYRFELDKA